jgi:predicted aldo/keto reductase-like oxidoreductase
LDCSCVTRVVIGMATPEQVAENMKWVAESSRVPPALWTEAKQLGLIAFDLASC